MMSSLTKQTSSTDPNTSSSMTATSTTTTTTTTTTTPSKKKFGKNLNKLTKPPAPPTAAENSKANAASRNGLLLLSTNKRGSGSGPAKNGLLASSKPVAAPLPSLGLQYESSTSTHDVLLGAVVGAAACRAEQKPDAWGRAAAASNSAPSNKNNKKSSSAGDGDAPSPSPKQQPETVKDNTQSTAPEHSNEYSRSTTPPHARNEQQQQHLVASSNWDEYGGRESTAGGHHRGLVNTDDDGTNNKRSNNNNNNSSDSQQVYMSKLARERADNRRQEEASRAQEQKEKASQRLQALESKLGENGGKQNRNVVLEPLGSAAASSANGKTSSSRPTQQQRTLYDPNRTFSSLVGGGGADGKKPSGGTSVGSHDEQPRGGDVSPRPGSNPSGGAYSGPMIHLNSYEDRDRGEAPRAAAPRMLFDPKSGSMVAVSSRDDNKRANAKTAKRGRNKGKDVADDANKKAPVSGKNAGKSRTTRTKETTTRGKNKEKTKFAGKISANTERKLPRTRGVLYTRDDKGNCYCADGCDGDLGYGAHSVEGGRVRNPESYTEFMEQQQQLYKEQVPPSDDGCVRSMSADGYDSYPHHEHDNPYLATDESMGMGLHTGYGVDEQDETQYTPVQLDWLKPNEKIELVTGMDEESPTLQATAREWAPSQAALSAAAQAAVMPSLGSHEDDDNSNAGVPSTTLEPRENPATSNILLGANSEDEEDEDDDDDSPVSKHVEKTFRRCFFSRII